MKWLKKDHNDSAARIGLPPLPADREASYAYYRLAFLPDGYPGKRIWSGTEPHPLYGAYVLRDYLRVYRKTGDKAYLEAAGRVGRAAIRRMSAVGRGLLFWYEPESRITHFHRRYASGLTQSYYLVEFHNLYEATGNTAFQEAANLILASLSIPLEEGGVLASSSAGVSIEELPDRPCGHVLNGWITALVNLDGFARKTGSEEARDLFERNIECLVRLLPIYDVPQVLNTRYQLRGYAWLRLELRPASNLSLANCHIDIPSVGAFPIAAKGTSRWDSYFASGVTEEFGTGRFRVTSRCVKLNTVLSMASGSQANQIAFECECAQEGQASILLGTGKYEPGESGLKTRGWTEIERRRIPQGYSSHRVEIPWRDAWLVAYPTNFKKRIHGRNFNAYHWTHIQQCRRLHEITGLEVLRHFAQKWEGYTKEWPDFFANHADRIECRHWTELERAKK